MANIVQYGFRPLIGGANTIQVRRFYCDGTNNSTAIFVGDIVKAHSNGGVIASTAGAVLANVGVVVGIFDTNGIPVGHPMAAVSTKYLTASVVGYVDVALALPGCLFIGQSATVSIAATDIFGSAPLVATAGSQTTARSNHRIGTVTTGASDFLILDVVQNGVNAVGSVNCDVIVQFNGSMFGQGTGLGL